MKRLRQLLGSFKATETYIKQLASRNSEQAHEALYFLKEREALQSGALRQVDLSGSNLTRATFAKALLDGVNFQGAQLTTTYFYDAHLQDAVFRGSNLQQANLRAAVLRGADFTGADLTGANLARADLTGAMMQQIQAQDANFWNARLHGADFTGADLTGANFAGAQCDRQTVLPDGSHWSHEDDWRAFTTTNN